MTVADADTIVQNMRALRLSVGELGREDWRAGLKNDRPPPVAGDLTTGSGEQPGAARATDSPHPQRHDKAVDYVSHLATNGSLSPQHRGLELEKILLDVLNTERLRPRHNIVNPGEQIDLSFVIRESYYLLECRWHREPQGMPALRDFSEKVRRKAEGTFGVLLSMSGFVGTINETASEGHRLNCVGITYRELMLVLEGMRTFVDVVQTARHEASNRSRFYTSV